MNNQPPDPPADPAALRAALASPFRLELLGLFGEAAALSVSDMAERTGRPATSIYHHLRVLESAGILEEKGTRPKGKRFETLYAVVESRLELEVDPDDEASKAQIAQAVRATFRTAERDFVAALDRQDLIQEGPARNIISFQLHARMSSEFLARLNERLRAIEELFSEADSEPDPDGQFLSLTFALAPIRGRRAGPTPPEGNES